MDSQDDKTYDKKNLSERIKRTEEFEIGETTAFWANRQKYQGLRRFLRFLFYVFLGFVIFLLVVAVAVGVWWKRIHDPIQNRISQTDSDPTLLPGWLILRDFDEEPVEMRSKLLKKYRRRLQDIHENISNDDPVINSRLRRVGFFLRRYSQERDQLMSEWAATKISQPAGQINYRVVRVSPEEKYISSADIQPSPALLEFIEKLKEVEESQISPPSQSQTESNVRSLFKEWFLEQMIAYDEAPDDRKVRTLTDAVSELNDFSMVYNHSREEAGLSPLSDLEQIRELHYMTDAWFDLDHPEETARLFWFKDLILAINVNLRAGKAEKIESLILFPPESPKTISLGGGLVKRFLKGRGTDSGKVADAPSEGSVGENQEIPENGPETEGENGDGSGDLKSDEAQDEAPEEAPNDVKDEAPEEANGQNATEPEKAPESTDSPETSDSSEDAIEFF